MTLVSDVKVLPSSARSYILDLRHRYAVRAGNDVPIDSGAVHPDDVRDIRFSQLGLIVLLPTHAADSPATLSHLIGNIVGIRAEPKMAVHWPRNTANDVDIRFVIPDTRWVVTCVQDMEAVRDRLLSPDLPCDPMGKRIPESSTKTDDAVPFDIGAAAIPASYSGTKNVLPESIRYRGNSGGMRTRAARSTAKVSIAVIDGGHSGKESTPALTADARDGTLRLHQDYPLVSPRPFAAVTGLSCADSIAHRASAGVGKVASL